MTRFGESERILKKGGISLFLMRSYNDKIKLPDFFQCSERNFANTARTNFSWSNLFSLANINEPRDPRKIEFEISASTKKTNRIVQPIMNQNDKRSIINSNVSSDHFRKSRRHCHSAILENECTETVLENHENRHKASRKKKESQRHSARNKIKNSIRKVSDTRAELISQNLHVPSVRKVDHHVNISRCKSLDKIDEKGKNTKRHKHRIHHNYLQEKDSVRTYRDKNIFRILKDHQRYKESRYWEKSFLCKEKRGANDLQTKKYEKYADFSSSTSTDSGLRNNADCKCKNSICTLKEDHDKSSKLSFAQKNNGSARTRIFVPTKRVSYVSKEINCNDRRKVRLKNTDVKSVDNDKSAESKFYNNNKSDLDNNNSIRSLRRQNKNNIKINLYPIESNDESNDNPGVGSTNADYEIANHDYATVNDNIEENHLIEFKKFSDKILSTSATTNEFLKSNDVKLERRKYQLCAVSENKETAINESDKSLSIVQNGNEQKSIKKQNQFELTEISQPISRDNNTDLKKSLYKDASTQYEQSMIIYGKTKLSETSSQTLKLKEKVYLSRKDIADVIKTLCKVSETQCSTEMMKRKSKFYECSRKCGNSKRNEKELRCAMARYIKKIVLSETRRKNKLENDVKIIMAGRNSKPSKIEVMNERPGGVSIIYYNVMESVSPIVKKNILPRWAESSAGESSGYKSVNNYEPDINGTGTSLELLHNKNMENERKRINVRTEVENVKCSSEEDQRSVISKKYSSDLNAHFLNEYTQKMTGTNYPFIPAAHQCTVELSNETEQIKRETISICKTNSVVNARHNIDMKCDNDKIVQHNVDPWLHKYIHTQNVQYSVQNKGLLTTQEEAESTTEENHCLNALCALWKNMRNGVTSTDDESISSKSSKNPNISSNKLLAQLPRPPLPFLMKFKSFENPDFDLTDVDVTVSDADISRVESTVATDISISSETGISHTDHQTNDSADNIPFNQKLYHESNNAPHHPPPPSFLPIPYSLSCASNRRDKILLNNCKEPPPACNVPLPETWKKSSDIRSRSTSFSILHFRKRGKSVNVKKSLDNDYNDACQLNELPKNAMKTKKTSRNLFSIFRRKKENETDVTTKK